MRTRRTVLLAAGVLLATAACGSDRATSSPKLSATEFRAKANAICADGNAKIGAVVGDLFASGAPDPAKAQPALDQVLAVSQSQVDAIGALAPPADLQADLDAMVSELRSAIATAKQQGGPAYWSSDDNPFAATMAKAKALGLDQCYDDGQ